MNIDWSKAPEGYPIWIEDLKPDVWKDMGGWHKEEDDKYVDEDGRFWSKPEERFYRVYRNPNESWTGTGLPPVGTVCQTERNEFLRRVEILCIGEHRVFVRDEHGEEIALLLEGREFLPIRTQEQIEAEEREKAVDAMYELIMLGNSHGIRQHLKDLYDAGYRKCSK